MISIRAVLSIAAAAALVSATAASAQAVSRGQHNSDGSYGLRSYSHHIGDAAIETASQAGGSTETASVAKSAKTLAVAEVRTPTTAR